MCLYVLQACLFAQMIVLNIFVIFYLLIIIIYHRTFSPSVNFNKVLCIH